MTKADQEKKVALEKRFSVRRRQTLYVASVFLLVFIPFTIFQILAYQAVADEGIIDFDMALLSAVVNIAMIFIVFTFVVFYFTSILYNWPGPTFFYPAILIGCGLVLSIMIFHIHLAGTQNSLLVVSILTTVMVLSGFIRWRDSLLMLGIANAALLLVIFLEYTNVLDYAPLLRMSDDMKMFFMDPRVIAMNLTLYALLNLTAVAITFRFQRTREKAISDLSKTNQQLKQEIQDRLHSEQAREKLIAELQQADKHVKTLKSILPICVHCKKIRDDKGYWAQVETYFNKQSGTEFTHSLCPDCLTELYPDLAKDLISDKSDDETL